MLRYKIVHRTRFCSTAVRTHVQYSDFCVSALSVRYTVAYMRPSVVSRLSTRSTCLVPFLHAFLHTCLLCLMNTCRSNQCARLSKPALLFFRSHQIICITIDFIVRRAMPLIHDPCVMCGAAVGNRETGRGVDRASQGGGWRSRFAARGNRGSHTSQ